MTKNIIIIFSFGVIIIAIVVGYLVYVSQSSADLESLLLDKEGMIGSKECSERNLSDKIILLESEYCSACKIVIPRLQELEKELGVEIIYLDLSKEENQSRAKEFKIWPKWTPTVLIGCNVLIGAHPKEKYKEVIERFLNY
ncbi:hypothetical protein AMJ49_07180 [Parcubacteria bacterium DG_74_2]|nr:MAG: hypothetical protein AMJ49_07180 [Parcubacteria bacterium DG_74_2]